MKVSQSSLSFLSRIPFHLSAGHLGRASREAREAARKRHSEALSKYKAEFLKADRPEHEVLWIEQFVSYALENGITPDRLEHDAGNGDLVKHGIEQEINGWEMAAFMAADAEKAW